MASTRRRRTSTGTTSDLVTDAPPIYIQEKIDPRVLIENLRRTAARPEEEPELTLFDSFDGLDDLEQVEFYKHDANWSNRMILGDSLQVMASLAEREKLRGKVQMVYIDPPYGIKFGSNWQVSARNRDVTRRQAGGCCSRGRADQGVPGHLGARDPLLSRPTCGTDLLVARDLLTESGSCFVQIGDENVHLVRSLMDEVFGAENFVSQITFQDHRCGSFAAGRTFLLRSPTTSSGTRRTSRRSKYRQLYRAARTVARAIRDLHQR